MPASWASCRLSRFRFFVDIPFAHHQPSLRRAWSVPKTPPPVNGAFVVKCDLAAVPVLKDTFGTMSKPAFIELTVLSDSTNPFAEVAVNLVHLDSVKRITPLPPNLSQVTVVFGNQVFTWIVASSYEAITKAMGYSSHGFSSPAMPAKCPMCNQFHASDDCNGQ